MQTYIINLERSKDRRKYMEELLAPYSCLKEAQFIPAVDGTLLAEEDIDRLFDQEHAIKKYGRYAKKTEIGCTLSHRKCYQRLIESKDHYAFIMEDDILFHVSPKDLEDILPRLRPHIETDRPTAILLFGEYWWTTSQKLSPAYSLKSVYEAISAQGYLINKSAADILLRGKAYILADDWGHIISQGIHVKALHPHVIDQEWSSFETTVSTDGYGSFERKNLSMKNYLLSYWHGGIKHFLKLIGHFDPHRIPEGTPEWAIRLGI